MLPALVAGKVVYAEVQLGQPREASHQAPPHGGSTTVNSLLQIWRQLSWLQLFPPLTEGLMAGKARQEQ